MRHLERILLAVDDSAGATAAIDAAGQLAKETGATVEVLHVWQPPYPMGDYADQLMVRADDGTLKGVPHILFDRAQGVLGGAVKRLRQMGLDVVLTCLVEGAAGEAIIDATKRSKFDLVVGTHGRSGVPRMVMGSVAEWVLRRSEVPVLTVHAAPRADAVARAS